MRVSWKYWCILCFPRGPTSCSSSEAQCKLRLLQELSRNSACLPCLLQACSSLRTWPPRLAMLEHWLHLVKLATLSSLNALHWVRVARDLHEV